MYNSTISSSLLFHFTKSEEVIVSILKNGFYPMTAIEDVSFMMPNYKEAKIGIPMVCFTDIPIEQSKKHREEYGQFGLAMKKEWGMKHGLNPILYVVKDSEVYNAYNHLQYVVLKQYENEKNDQEGILDLIEAFMNYAGFMKEYTNDPAMQAKPFYDEREWRYLPPFKEETEGMDGYCNRLLPDMVDNVHEKSKLDKSMQEKYALKFDIDDVAQIILPTSCDIKKIT